MNSNVDRDVDSDTDPNADRDADQDVKFDMYINGEEMKQSKRIIYSRQLPRS